MKYQIYQITDIETARYAFMSWDFAKSHNFNISDYAQVYEGEIDEHNMYAALEDLFEIFNMRRPSDFTGHSLSVSDIVVLTEGSVESTFYCDSFGWENISKSVDEPNEPKVTLEVEGDTDDYFEIDQVKLNRMFIEAGPNTIVYTGNHMADESTDVYSTFCFKNRKYAVKIH